MVAQSSTLSNTPGGAPGRARRRAPVIWPWALIALAWALALGAELTNQSHLISHDYLIEESLLPLPLAILIFLAGWQVMTAGMMLPSSLPIMRMMTHAARRQRHTVTTIAIFVAAYASIWTAFGVAAFFGDILVHWSVEHWSGLAENSYLIGAGTLALAALFQFSALKTHCLMSCRHRIGLFVRYYHTGSGSAWKLGLRHGLNSLSNCWALMLVMFGIGMGGIVWMAALAGMMWVEQVAPNGRLAAMSIGVALLALAGAWVVTPLSAAALPL
jgi:predicted metal-binding membrane protein